MRPATPTVSRNQYAPLSRKHYDIGNFLAMQWELGGIPLPRTLPTRYFAPVILLRILLIAILPLTFAACASSSKKPKSSARMYNGDESPHIHMYPEAEAPGSALHN